MKCEKCGKPADGEPLYRNAPKGVTPVKWRHYGCLDSEYIPDDGVIRDAHRVTKGIIKDSDHIITGEEWRYKNERINGRRL